MPHRCDTHPLLPALIAGQDQVLSRDQALAGGLSAAAIKYRLHARWWQVLLPNVYLTHLGEPSRRQMLVAAQLYGGPGSAIDGADACRYHGVKAVALDDDRVRIVAPWGCAQRSVGFVVVRRTATPITVVTTERLRYVDPATAVIVATRAMRRERSVLAALSDALQRRITTYDELVRAHVLGPPRGARNAAKALETLGAGTRSVAEADFRRLVLARPRLVSVEYNVWLRLPTGIVVCVDALIVSSAVVHETNGRVAHAREDLFEDMQKRSDVLTASGFAVLHNPPSRILQNGPEVIAQFEQCHQLYDGRGLPAGVTIIAEPRAVWDG